MKKLFFYFVILYCLGYGVLITFYQLATKPIRKSAGFPAGLSALSKIQRIRGKNYIPMNTRRGA